MRYSKLLVLAASAFTLVTCNVVSADGTTSGQYRYWKGNIHTHSLWSDGDDFPEMIAEWYRTHGYNFLALSDHNVLSQGRRWMKASAISGRGGATVIPKYRQRFGDAWVETRGEGEELEVRLKPLDEFRYLVEQRGQFIMIPCEEISDRAEGVPVHMNATNILEAIEPQGGATVREAMTNNLRAVEAQAKQRGREILLHLNHPNFGYAITAEDIAAVIQERFFEVYNGHPAVGHLGDQDHPGIERLWDIANTIRLGDLHAPPLYGVATDDSHNYHGKPGGANVGRGWVMVRARFLTPEHLLRAMDAGDFYASSGVSLTYIHFDKAEKLFTVEVDARSGERYTIEFIGTRSNYDRTATARDVEGKRLTKKYSSDVGAVLQESQGNAATYHLQGDELYVRAVVTSSKHVDDPSLEDQHQQAWTQPMVP